jgi:hypothetical protein
MFLVIINAHLFHIGFGSVAPAVPSAEGDIEVSILISRIPFIGVAFIDVGGGAGGIISGL